MKIVIAGTGAMGATYGSMLKKSGNEVDFLDMWQENVDMINKQGIKFNNLGIEENIKANAYLPSEYNKNVDLIIIFTKSMQLKDMLKNISHIIKENTRVLCMLNGLGHIETLKEFVKEENILMGVTVMTASMSGAGKFSVSAYGKTEIQNISENSKEKALEVVNLINESGLPSVYSNDIMYSIWRKACINGTMNCSCTLLDCNISQLSSVPNLRQLFGIIVKEFVMVAKQEGVTIDENKMIDLACWFTTEEFEGSKHYPSMHQDLIQKNRKTEIDFLNGYISRKGKEYGIDTKYCDLITTLIHAREEILECK